MLYIKLFKIFLIVDSLNVIFIFNINNMYISIPLSIFILKFNINKFNPPRHFLKFYFLILYRNLVGFLLTLIRSKMCWWKFKVPAFQLSTYQAHSHMLHNPVPFLRPGVRKGLRKEVSNSRRLIFAHSVPQLLMPYS